MEDQWQGLLERLEITADDAYEALLTRYAEPHRHYHTLTHIQSCLEWLERWSAENSPLVSVDRNALELALWYHDAIYDPRAKDNEAASARMLTGLPLPKDLAAKAQQLILSTDHRQPAQTALEALIVSIDLAILGAPTDAYADYARAIRLEYAWVPDAEYATGRTQVLQQFLERPAIYPEPWFGLQLETAARENLAQELDAF